MKPVVAEIRREQILKLASEGRREDGRGLDDFRELEFELNPIGTAEGSARIRLGKTDIIVGVKMSPGKPYQDHPDEGVLSTGCEMKPMAHGDFDGGAPKPTAIEFARVIDRGIRESGMIDFGKLCLEPGEKVWMLNLDIQALDYDGNMIDAGTIACNLALRNTVVPAARFGLGEDFPLHVGDSPVSTTFVKLGDCLLLDPTDVEESVAEARLTVTTDQRGDIRAMQKAFSGAFLYEEIVSTVDKSVHAGNVVRERLKQG